MWKRPHPIEPGHAPPRPILAIAAVAAAAILHGALLGLFQQEAPRQMLAATPTIERALAGCDQKAGRPAREACRLAVADRARRAPGTASAVAMAQP